MRHKPINGLEAAQSVNIEESCPHLLGHDFDLVIELGYYKSRVIAPKKVIYNLRQAMRVQVEGYKFTDAYEKGWDGYTYYITETGSFLSGMAHYVYKLLHKYYGEVEIIPVTDKLLPKNTNDQVGNGWTLYEDQKAVIEAINNHTYPDGTPCTHGVIDAAVNFGKTPIFASMVYNYQDYNFLIICDSTLLFNQIVKFFFGIYGEDEIGIIQGKTTRLRRVTVAMIQSLNNQLKDAALKVEISNYFDFLISDECHGLTNKTGKSVLSKLKAPYRYFFSGTPYDQGKKTSRLEMRGLAGDPIKRVSNKRNQEVGRSLKATVFMHKIEYPVMYSAKLYLRYLVMSEERNLKIAEIVNSNPGKKILIVCKFVQHCEKILAHLDKKVYYTTGQDPNKESVVSRYAKDPSGVLLTTFIIKQGINIKDIQILIIAFGGSDEVSVKQVAGRAIRLDGVSTEVEIHDFYDNGGNLIDHSNNRIKYYEEEGYTIKKQYNE